VLPVRVESKGEGHRRPCVDLQLKKTHKKTGRKEGPQIQLIVDDREGVSGRADKEGVECSRMARMNRVAGEEGDASIERAAAGRRLGKDRDGDLAGRSKKNFFEKLATRVKTRGREGLLWTGRQKRRRKEVGVQSESKQGLVHKGVWEDGDVQVSARGTGGTGSNRAFSPLRLVCTFRARGGRRCGTERGLGAIKREVKT